MKIKDFFEKHKLPIIISTIVLGIFLLTLGFSAFGQKLFITGMFANVRVPADIRVTGIFLDGNNHEGSSNNEDYDVKNILGNITLPNADSSVTYNVEVTNFEGPEMGIYDLTGLPDNLEYTLEGYELKEKICEDNRCTLGVRKNFKITIKYKDGKYDKNNTTFDFTIDFDFRSYHKVSYEGLTYSDSYPQEVMDRDTLEFTFNENEKTSGLKVTVDNLNNTSFKIEGQKFTLENVTGDVVIKYSASKTTPFIEFMQQQKPEDDEHLNFYDINQLKNGVYLYHESINYDYPVYYYRGMVDNRLVYAGHCWQIVRTTETGGLKIVYDGEYKKNECNDDHDRLGSEMYNEKPNGKASPSQVGYMYGEVENILTISESRINDMEIPPKDISNLMTGLTSIISGVEAVWDGNTYTITNPQTYEGTTPRELYKAAVDSHDARYTCLSEAGSCTKIYYLYKRSSEVVYAIELTGGLLGDQAIDGKTVKIGTIIGHNVSWDSTTKEYTLVDTKTVTDLDNLEDDIRGGLSGSFPTESPNAFHYTCLTNSNKCQEVYYIYYNDYGNYHDEYATGLFGIKLEDGRNVTETLNALLSGSSNTIDSHAKAYIDSWFTGESSDFTRGEPLSDHIDELDDALWCNDRTVAGYHGWDIDADNHLSDNKYLHFDAYKRLVGEPDPTRPRLTCDSKNDTFTVANPKGNGALTYPIALLDADEAVLAGAIYEQATSTYLAANSDMFLMSPYYISDDHIRMFRLKKDGSLDSGYAASTYGIRPAIVLNSTMTISGGDGTAGNPYTVAKAS